MTALTPMNKEDKALMASMQSDFSELVQVRKELQKIPRLKLNNPLSDAVKGGLGKPGDFTCSTLGMNYGSSVTMIPIIITESASLLDKSTSEVKCSTKDLIKNNQGVLCRLCPHGEYWNDWGTRAVLKIPNCKTSLDMIIVLVDQKTQKILIENPMQINFRKNNHKAGRALLNFVTNDPSKISFGRKYTLYSREESKDKHDYFVIHSKKIEYAPLTMDEMKSIVPIAKQFIEWKKAGEMHFDHLDDDESYSHSRSNLSPEDQLPI